MKLQKEWRRKGEICLMPERVATLQVRDKPWPMVLFHAHCHPAKAHIPWIPKLKMCWPRLFFIRMMPIFSLRLSPKYRHYYGLLHCNIIEEKKIAQKTNKNQLRTLVVSGSVVHSKRKKKSDKKRHCKIIHNSHT